MVFCFLVVLGFYVMRNYNKGLREMIELQKGELFDESIDIEKDSVDGKMDRGLN